MTKYKRSYYVDSWSHSCFNQKEIGTDLAIKILELVDPVYYVERDPNEKTDSARLAANEPDQKVLIELYKKPNITYAILPGNYYYLHVTKPGLLITYDEEKNEVKIYSTFKIINILNRKLFFFKQNREMNW